MIEYLLGQAPLPPLPDARFVRSIRNSSAQAKTTSTAGGDESPRLDRFHIILRYMRQDADNAGFAVGDIAADCGFSEKRVENDLIALNRAGKVYTVIAREHGRRRRLWFAS